LMMAPAGATIATTTKQKRNRFVIIIVIIVLMIAMKKGIKKAGRQDDGPSINHPAGGVGGHRGCRNDTMRGDNGVVWDSSLATWIFLTFFSAACVDFLGRSVGCVCVCVYRHCLSWPGASERQRTSTAIRATTATKDEKNGRRCHEWDVTQVRGRSTKWGLPMTEKYMKRRTN
jgi:hypothetical protein